MKKGQISSQVFVYILAVFVIGAVLLFGFSAVRDLIQKGDEVSLLQLQNNIESSVETIGSDYGTIKKQTFNNIPSRFKEVCFVDLQKILADPGVTSMPGYPFMEDSVDSQTGENVFINPQGPAFNAGELSVTDAAGFWCVPVIRGSITVQMEGKGDKVEVRVMP